MFFVGPNCAWEQFDHYDYITLLLNYFFMLGGRAGGFTIILSVFSAGRKYKTSEGSSSANCQKTETCMVRACHTPRQPLQNHPSGHLGRWATPWTAEEMLDGQHQEWAFLLPMPEWLSRASCRKRLKEDLCWIICHNCLPDKPIGQWTELNWYMKPITWSTGSGVKGGISRESVHFI